MRYEGVVDMFQTVKMLRAQRPSMVQNEVEHELFLCRLAAEHAVAPCRINPSGALCQHEMGGPSNPLPSLPYLPLPVPSPYFHRDVVFIKRYVIGKI